MTQFESVCFQTEPNLYRMKISEPTEAVFPSPSDKTSATYQCTVDGLSFSTNVKFYKEYISLVSEDILKSSSGHNLSNFLKHCPNQMKMFTHNRSYFPRLLKE